jgi:hypothetical protein
MLTNFKMGNFNNKLSNKTSILVWTDESHFIINPNITFPSNEKLIVPISNVINSIRDAFECTDNDTYIYALDECKKLVSKYPIVISLQKEDYFDVLNDFNSEIMIDMFKFIIDNSPQDLVEWDYQYVKMHLPTPVKQLDDWSKNNGKFDLYDYVELVEDVNKLFNV